MRLRLLNPFVSAVAGSVLLLLALFVWNGVRIDTYQLETVQAFEDADDEVSDDGSTATSSRFNIDLTFTTTPTEAIQLGEPLDISSTVGISVGTPFTLTYVFTEQVGGFVDPSVFTIPVVANRTARDDLAPDLPDLLPDTDPISLSFAGDSDTPTFVGRGDDGLLVPFEAGPLGAVYSAIYNPEGDYSTILTSTAENATTQAPRAYQITAYLDAEVGGEIVTVDATTDFDLANGGDNAEGAPAVTLAAGNPTPAQQEEVVYTAEISDTARGLVQGIEFVSTDGEGNSETTTVPRSEFTGTEGDVVFATTTRNYTGTGDAVLTATLVYSDAFSPLGPTAGYELPQNSPLVSGLEDNSITEDPVTEATTVTVGAAAATLAVVPTVAEPGTAISFTVSLNGVDEQFIGEGTIDVSGPTTATLTADAVGDTLTATQVFTELGTYVATATVPVDGLGTLTTEQASFVIQEAVDPTVPNSITIEVAESTIETNRQEDLRGTTLVTITASNDEGPVAGPVEISGSLSPVDLGAVFVTGGGTGNVFTATIPAANQGVYTTTLRAGALAGTLDVSASLVDNPDVSDSTTVETVYPAGTAAVVIDLAVGTGDTPPSVTLPNSNTVTVEVMSGTFTGTVTALISPLPEPGLGDGQLGITVTEKGGIIVYGFAIDVYAANLSFPGIGIVPPGTPINTVPDPTTGEPVSLLSVLPPGSIVVTVSYQDSDLTGPSLQQAAARVLEPTLAIYDVNDQTVPLGDDGALETSELGNTLVNPTNNTVSGEPDQAGIHLLVGQDTIRLFLPFIQENSAPQAGPTEPTEPTEPTTPTTPTTSSALSGLTLVMGQGHTGLFR
jgi:hypothetical protein